MSFRTFLLIAFSFAIIKLQLFPFFYLRKNGLQGSFGDEPKFLFLRIIKKGKRRIQFVHGQYPKFLFQFQPIIDEQPVDDSARILAAAPSPFEKNKQMKGIIEKFMHIAYWKQKILCKSTQHIFWFCDPFFCRKVSWCVRFPLLCAVQDANNGIRNGCLSKGLCETSSSFLCCSCCWNLNLIHQIIADWINWLRCNRIDNGRRADGNWGFEDTRSSRNLHPLCWVKFSFCWIIRLLFFPTRTNKRTENSIAFEGELQPATLQIHSTWREVLFA